MSIYQKNGLIVLLLALMFALLFASNGQLDRWASAFLKEPDGYFASAYEQRIFNHFRRKFPNARVKSVTTIGNDLKLELALPTSYQLLVLRDKDHRVKSVRRLIAGWQPNTENTTEGLDWLGQLFYRIDAGDTAALLDFLFFQEIGIHYGQPAARSTVARRLISDYPQIIRPKNIHMKQAGSVLEIRFTTDRLSDCFITLPLHRADRRPVDELQNALLKKIEKAATAEPNQKNAAGSFQRHANLMVPYLTDKVPHLPVMRYQRTGVDEILPEIRWAATGDANLLMNNVLPVAYFGENAASAAEWESGKQLITKLYQWCIAAGQLTDLPVSESTRLTIEYRGYNTRRLSIASLNSFQTISEQLHREGNFYYYPAKVEHRSGNITVNGMLYIKPFGGAAHYHFIEIAAVLNNQGQLQRMHWVFYPYIRN